MDNTSSSSPPPPLPPPNPPQPQASPAASSPPSPEVKPNLELVPYSAAAANPDPNGNPQSPPTTTTKKSPPLPWTHQETVSLIQTYQEKWYNLKKGQLKANQWEDVAAAVASRCGYDVPSKTATQCRHKIEKLRKRYRAERLKPYPNFWQYFELMDRMERGPTAITVAAAAVKYQTQKNKEAENDDGEGNYVGLELKKNKLKSINNIVRGGEVGVSGNGNRNNVSRIGMMSGNLGGAGENARALKGLRTSLIQKRKGYSQGDPESDEADDDDDDDDDEEEELEEEEEEEERGSEGKGGGRVVVVGKELAAEIRGFADRFMRMEKKKVEMMRETERFRMEMEKKRMDMIVEAQRKVVDTIGKAFGAHKKVKVGQEI